MRAILFNEFGGELRVEEVPEPTPAADGVVIEVGATGVCRSDWHGWQGHDSDIQRLPHVPGHELAGVVCEVGAGVSQWRPGDRVTMPFVAGCGDCPQCDRGDQQVCDHQFQPGFTAWGSFAERVAVRYADGNLVRLPDDMPFSAAAALGCRVATSYRAVKHQGGVGEGDWLVVYGCGGVGLSAIMIARALGARVIAVDVSEKALALAQEFGAEQVINSGEVDDPAAAVHDLTSGGADVSLDAFGGAATATAAILSLRKRGRHVQVGLLAGADESPRMPMGRVIAWELELAGSHGLQAHVYPELLELVTSGRLPIDRMVTEVVGFEGGAAALAKMDGPAGAGVTVIDPAL